MPRALLLALVLASPVLAGCLAAPLETASLAEGLPVRVAVGDAPFAEAVHWTGAELEAPDPAPDPTRAALCFTIACPAAPACGPGACEATPFRIEGDGSADVQVRAQSLRNYTVGPLVRVRDAAGDVVAEGKMTDWLSIAVLEKAAPGDYVAEVIALYGEGAYEAAIVVSRPALLVDASEARDLLPNLRTIQPSDLRVETPAGGHQGLASGLLGAKGCSFDEAVEGMARRCLRFSNGIANVGEGPLEVALAPQDAVGALAGSSRFVQLIHRTDGSVRESPAGPASYHAAHGHYHYAGLATYELFAYDEGAMDRGEKVGQGRKAGFCFYDTAMVDLTRPDVGPQGYDGRGCLDPSATAQGRSWYTGVSPGFTDFYGWYLSDQFVEITGLPDGTYELVTAADGAGSLEESDTSDNAATAVFRLRGDDVEVLWTTGA